MDVVIAQEHVLEQTRVPPRRQRLVPIGKVPIVRARPARQTHEHGRVQLLRVPVPLLLGVVPENLLVQTSADSTQRRFLAVARFAAVCGDHALGVVPRLHRILAHHVRVFKQRVYRRLRRGYGHQPLDTAVVLDPPFDPVVERDPLAELVDVFPHAFELRVKEVRAVFAASYAVGGDVIVAVAADVVAFVDDDGGHVELA